MFLGEVIAIFFSDPHTTDKYTVWAECSIYES